MFNLSSLDILPTVQTPGRPGCLVPNYYQYYKVTHARSNCNQFLFIPDYNRCDVEMTMLLLLCLSVVIVEKLRFIHS